MPDHDIVLNFAVFRWYAVEHGIRERESCDGIWSWWEGEVVNGTAE